MRLTSREREDSTQTLPNRSSYPSLLTVATADLREDRRACLQPLAKCLGINPETLIIEYEIFSPYAEQYYTSHNCSTRATWAANLKSLARARTQARYCMRAALVWYAAWIAPSSSCDAGQDLLRFKIK